MARPTSRTEPKSVPRPVSWLGWWVVLMAMWLVLVGTFDPAELVLGAIAAAIAATAAVLVLFPGVDRFDARARWALRAWRLPWQAVLDTGIVFAALWRHLRGQPVRGRFQTLPFRHGGEGAHDLGRRASAKAAGSFAANTYVLGIDEDRDCMLYHELVATEGSSGCDPLGLG